MHTQQPHFDHPDPEQRNTASSKKPRRSGVFEGQIWVADDFDDYGPDMQALFESDEEDHYYGRFLVQPKK